MSDQDLHAPLNRNGDRRGGRKLKLTLLGSLWATLSCALTVLVLWLAVAEDPLGGEPVALLTLPATETGAEQMASGEDLEFRDALPPGADPDAEVQDASANDVEDIAPTGNAVDPLDAQFDALAEQQDQQNTSRAELVTAPVDAVMEEGTHGPLPRISIDGETPARVYARPLSDVEADANTAKISILVGGLGLSASGTTAAINSMPEQITFAFAPYAHNLQDWVHRARQNGHEVMLQLPMEPFDYPDNDPGPHTLLSSLAPPENTRRLEWLLSRATGYFGVTNYMGAKFTASPDSLRSVLEHINQRGLVYVEDGTSARSSTPLVSRQIGLSATVSDIVIDAIASADAIDAALSELESLALERGVALGVTSALPVSIERINAWANSLEAKGIYLVPVSGTIALRQNHK